MVSNNASERPFWPKKGPETPNSHFRANYPISETRVRFPAKPNVDFQNPGSIPCQAKRRFFGQTSIFSPNVVFQNSGSIPGQAKRRFSKLGFDSLPSQTAIFETRVRFPAKPNGDFQNSG